MQAYSRLVHVFVYDSYMSCTPLYIAVQLNLSIYQPSTPKRSPNAYCVPTYLRYQFWFGPSCLFPFNPTPARPGTDTPRPPAVSALPSMKSSYSKLQPTYPTPTQVLSCVCTTGRYLGPVYYSTAQPYPILLFEGWILLACLSSSVQFSNQPS